MTVSQQILAIVELTLTDWDRDDIADTKDVQKLLVNRAHNEGQDQCQSSSSEISMSCEPDCDMSLTHSQRSIQPHPKRFLLHEPAREKSRQGTAFANYQHLVQLHWELRSYQGTVSQVAPKTKV